MNNLTEAIQWTEELLGKLRAKREEEKPAPIDPLADVKAAHKAGKVIQYLDRMNKEWTDIDSPSWFPSDQYRVKPWSLTNHLPGFRPLVDGEEWHRQDFAEDMLPEGWRPLLKGETDREDCEWLSDHGGNWQKIAEALSSGSANEHWNRRRTRRPLPPLPDPQRELVPLEASDVPPGSVFRLKDDPDGFDAFAAVNASGVVLANRLGHRFSWEKMMNQWEIKRPGEDWQPCSKAAIRS
jgi:hypothetical protein